MEETTLIALTRTIIGGGIFITSMITGIDSQIQLLALFLLGVPFEVIKKEKN